MHSKNQLRVGMRAAFASVRTGNAERLRALLARTTEHDRERLIDARIADEDGLALVEFAAAAGQIRCLRALLVTDAVSPARAGDALRRAVLAAHPDSARLLISYLDQCVAQGRAPASERNRHVVRALTSVAKRRERKSRSCAREMLAWACVREALQSELAHRPTLAAQLETLVESAQQGWHAPDGVAPRPFAPGGADRAIERTHTT